MDVNGGINLSGIAVQHVPYIVVICHSIRESENSFSAALAGKVQACYPRTSNQMNAQKTSVSKWASWEVRKRGRWFLSPLSGVKPEGPAEELLSQHFGGSLYSVSVSLGVGSEQRWQHFAEEIPQHRSALVLFWAAKHSSLALWICELSHIL